MNTKIIFSKIIKFLSILYLHIWCKRYNFFSYLANAKSLYLVLIEIILLVFLQFSLAGIVIMGMLFVHIVVFLISRVLFIKLNDFIVYCWINSSIGMPITFDFFEYRQKLNHLDDAAFLYDLSDKFITWNISGFRRYIFLKSVKLRGKVTIRTNRIIYLQLKRKKLIDDLKEFEESFIKEKLIFIKDYKELKLRYDEIVKPVKKYKITISYDKLKDYLSQ